MSLASSLGLMASTAHQLDRRTWPVPPGPVWAKPGGCSSEGAMYSVEITVEKDRVTGETKVLSSTTMLPQNHCLQGVKVYEDELK
ncbi:PREDICTED: paralemmin-1-like, partial [Acanthisitta chloris]|uniref:paralemmin-1-like n=1 Tax=Acanthisitta chloris TaxID=57068 RepID=UPI0004F0E7CA